MLKGLYSLYLLEIQVCKNSVEFRVKEKEACGCFDEAQAICSIAYPAPLVEKILTVARWTQQPVFPNLSLALGNILC